MSPRIINCEQGSDEWVQARVGIVTASKFSDAVAGGAGLVRSKYMRQLAGEVVTGIPAETYRDASMDRGKKMEPYIRDLYAMVTDANVQTVGFATNDGLIAGRTIGASPDGLIGPKGGLEAKSEKPENLILRLQGSVPFPSEHMAQVQGNMWVCEREWWDIAIGYQGMPLWRHRVRRDENYIARLRTGLAAFMDDLDALVEWIRRYQQ